MKTTVLAFLLFCCLGATPKRPVCSPVFTPFKEWLHRYDAERFIIVEGYFLPTTEKGHASKFKVIRNSDASIKIDGDYEVYEYGPFGSSCEMYEMGANIDKELTGKNKPRLLITYKGRSINGKLVCPIFWDAGVNATDNKIVTKEYDYDSSQYILYECPVSLEEVWNQVSKGSVVTAAWKEQASVISN
ncbi:hypothetical protein [Cellulophaga sp. HaHa_2_1]|uniref:hypothetical protein n=1 Tax=Cellulophaga sp. HaHa_2_1 TaxID=2749994 RepID=UPI001C4F3CB0|nr:hypothetical protein [Cellulophaga sp. HaHa_2_1]QXP54131.1 hypothetical protein H0I24_09455 [Cellulophaga sp. HaHa_2_1]